jgi:hypothetical protein
MAQIAVSPENPHLKRCPGFEVDNQHDKERLKAMVGMQLDKALYEKVNGAYTLVSEDYYEEEALKCPRSEEE